MGVLGVVLYILDKLLVSISNPNDLSKFLVFMHLTLDVLNNGCQPLIYGLNFILKIKYLLFELSPLHLHVDELIRYEHRSVVVAGLRTDCTVEWEVYPIGAILL